jgi:DNA adenine methylase
MWKGMASAMPKKHYPRPTRRRRRKYKNTESSVTQVSAQKRGHPARPKFDTFAIYSWWADLWHTHPRPLNFHRHAPVLQTIHSCGLRAVKVRRGQHTMPGHPSPIYLNEDQLEMFQVTASKAGVQTLTRRRRLIAFGWYGGKFSHLDWLLPLLPACHHYCEPFGGSAAALLNRDPSPVETYNDIDGEVANFFRVLREKGQELVRAIGLTPFSREEFFIACSTNGHPIPDLERARRFFIRARQVRTGLAQTASVGRWANCKNTSRAGMSGVVSRWLGSVETLPKIVERLLRVQIENRPATEVLRLYDGKSTLFYCDPPYPHSSRTDNKAYGAEMTDDEHRQLASTLHGMKAKVAVSGYRCDLMDTLYKDFKRHDAISKMCH